MMYCVYLWKWTQHPAPAKYQCAAMTQQPAGTYTLRRVDCSTHPFRMGRPRASYLLQGAHETRPIRPRSPFVHDFPFKTKFPPISPISFNIRPWSSVPFPPLRLPKILIRYQRNQHIGFNGQASYPPSKSSPGLISSFQKISNPIQPMKIYPNIPFVRI